MVPYNVNATPAKTIVLIAGPVRTHDRIGHHDYLAGCKLLADLLRRSSGINPIVVHDGWPEDSRITNDCAAIVFYDGGGGNQGFLRSPERIERIQTAVDAGVGIVMIHKTVAFPLSLTNQGKAWIGGTYTPGTSSRGHWRSRHASFVDHPVSAGVESWRIRDGWLNNIQFVDKMSGVTPLLWSGRKHGGADAGGNRDIVSWVYDRPDGGRSFSFTGLDAHSAWSLPGLRRFVTNGILWTAGNEIPASGVSCDMDSAAIDSYLSPRRSRTIGILRGIGKSAARALRLRRRW